MLKHKLLLMAAIILPLFISEAGLKVYYVRHGETPGNVQKKWAKVPKEQWPAFMKGKRPYLTPTGEEQAEYLVEKLKPYTFDFIAVSPTDRTRLTILPYLKANRLKGEIWADLAETNVNRSRTGQPPRKDLFEGPKATLKEGQEQFFTFREDARRQVVRFEGQLSSSEEQAISERVINRVLKEFGGQEKTVLLVGHGTAGRHLLRTFLGRSDGNKSSIENTKVWMVEQQADGKFKLRMYNDQATAE